MDFKKGWDRWLAISRKAANILGRIVVSIFYFTVMLPFSLGVTLFGDPLNIKKKPAQHWHQREELNDTITKARLQF